MSDATIQQRPEIAVVGAGYVGLTAGVCFSDFGIDVSLIEVNPERRRLLEEGRAPIYEPRLDELLKKSIAEGRLRIYSTISSCLKERQPNAVFLAVGTPATEQGTADLTDLQTAARTVAREAQGRLRLVIKSTVPAGTAAKVKTWISEQNGRARLSVVSNPEFLREGTAVADFMKPDRVVVGVESKEDEDFMRTLYGPLLRNGHPLLAMGHESAELAKYAANLMLASRVSTLNQIAQLSGACGADIKDIERVLKSDHRFGPHYLYAGLGYGGSCLPKDVASFIAMCTEKEVDASLARSVDHQNRLQRRWWMKEILRRFPEPVTLAVLGLAFKAQTDDIRDSVAVEIVPELLAKGYRLQCHDPKAMDVFARFLQTVPEESRARCVLAPRMDAALEGASAFLLLTEWHDYQQITPGEAAKRLSGRVLFDGKNIYEPVQWRDAGFTYVGVGR